MNDYFMVYKTGQSWPFDVDRNKQMFSWIVMYSVSTGLLEDLNSKIHNHKYLQ
jgi:hypothetical protein